jgi:hypothetical protein
MLISRYVFDGKPPEMKNQELKKRYFCVDFMLFLESSIYRFLSKFLNYEFPSKTLNRLSKRAEATAGLSEALEVYAYFVGDFSLIFVLRFLVLNQDIYPLAGFCCHFRLTIRKILKNSVNGQ